jgi:hypothetical protein
MIILIIWTDDLYSCPWASKCFSVADAQPEPRHQPRRNPCMPVNTRAAPTCTGGACAAGGRGTGLHGSPCCHTCCDAHRGVFNDQAARRINLQMRRSGQLHIRVRLAARHLVAAKNAAFRNSDQVHWLEHHLDLEPVRRRAPRPGHRPAASHVTPHQTDRRRGGLSEREELHAGVQGVDVTDARRVQKQGLKRVHPCKLAGLGLPG